MDFFALTLPQNADSFPKSHLRCSSSIIEILIEALAGHVGLSKIALHCTQIGRVGYSCTALVHLLRRPSFSLTVLDLYGNYIDNIGAGILSLGGLEIVMLSP
jgi:hypothetical protein